MALLHRCKLLLAFCLLLGSGSAMSERNYVFGVVPQQSAIKTAKLWIPVVEELARQSGLRLTLKSTRTIPEFEQELRDGRFDFAYMNPQHYATFSANPGYRALAKARDKTLHGILVVRQDSPIQQTSQLAGQQVAFPAPGAFGATLLAREHLRSRDIPITPVYVGSHDLVYLNVVQGRYPAGGGVPRTFDNMPSDIRGRLRVLWRSPGFPPHAIAAHPSVPAPAVTRIRDALFSLDRTPAGRDALTGLAIAGFETARDDDWQPIRDLRLQTLP